MFDTTHARRLFFRTLVFLCLGLIALGMGWSIPPALHAQVNPPPTCNQGTILFVSPSRDLWPEDQPLVTYLTGLGYQVDVRTALEVQAGDASGKVLVIISVTARSKEITTRLRDIPVPILTWEGWLLPDPNTRLTSGSVKVIGGVIVQGNQTGDDHAIVEITPLSSGANASISLQVVVSSSISVTQLQNQALVTMLNPDGQPSGQAAVASDDPDTTAPNDATITPLTAPVVELSASLFLPLIRKEQP